MLGHKWESAEGVIAESRTDMLAEQHGHHGHHGVQETRVYVVDVRMPSGRAFRASLPAPAGLRRELPVGTRVHLEVNEKTGEVRFDPSHPADHAPGQVSSLREAVHLARELRGEMAAGAAGVGVAGIAASLAGAAAAGHPGEGVRVVGGAEAAELVRELMGGGDRAAAIAKIRQMSGQGGAAPGAAGAAGGTTIGPGVHGVPGGHEVVPGGQGVIGGLHGGPGQSWTSGTSGGSGPAGGLGGQAMTGSGQPGRYEPAVPAEPAGFEQINQAPPSIQTPAFPTHGGSYPGQGSFSGQHGGGFPGQGGAFSVEPVEPVGFEAAAEPQTFQPIVPPQVNKRSTFGEHHDEF